MLHLDFPFTDGTLLLQPRFAGAPVALQILAILLGLAPLALVGWLYRTELRLVRPLAARTLLALRLLVVGAILALVGLQPVVARAVTEAVPGRVVVALDLSDSMGVTDPQRPLAEKLKLARALRLVTDLCDDKTLGEWLREAEHSGQVTWPLDGRGTRDAERQQFEQVVRRVDDLTRAQT